MPVVPIGVQTLSLRRPVRRALEAAGRIGADGVGLDLRTELPHTELSQTALRQLRKLLDDQRLTVGAAAFPLRRGFADPADLDRRVAAVMAAMTAAAQLGARVLTTPLGPLPDEDDEETLGRVTEAITAVAAHGDRVGARLAATTGAEPADRLAKLLARLPEGVVGVDLNPARLLAAGHDPVAVLQSIGPSVLHVRASDAVRDVATGGRIDVPLGRGSVDFSGLLAALEGHEYRGWVTVERSESPDPESELADAVAYLRTLLRDG